MTADEVVVICGRTIGQPLNRCLQKIGFPREKSTGGPVMRWLAEHIAQHGFEPWFVINEKTRAALEVELGRVICASGDTLFGLILISTDDIDDDISWLQEHRGKEAVIDCRA